MRCTLKCTEQFAGVQKYSKKNGTVTVWLKINFRLAQKVLSGSKRFLSGSIFVFLGLGVGKSLGGMGGMGTIGTNGTMGTDGTGGDGGDCN